MNKKTQMQKVLSSKQKNLDLIANHSNFVIDGFTAVARELEDVNNQIDKEQEEIEVSINSLTETRKGLEETKRRNVKIIENFKKLFEV